MIENEVVRNKLKNYLDVQLTDSNVIYPPS